MKTYVMYLSVLLLSFLSFTGIHAQIDMQQPIERLIIRQTATQVELLNLNADGSATLITPLEGISFTSLPGFEWNVPIAIDIAPSPQGEHVAFTARANDNRSALFLVSLNPLRVRQFDAPGIASLAWSSTGDALLLTRPTLFLGEAGGAISNGSVFVFNLATEAFTLVAENSSLQIIQSAAWSPNGERIILNIFDSDSTLDLQIADLYTIKRDGTDRQRLTNLRVQAPQSINFDQPVERNLCTITNIEWSVSFGRIYYVLTCSIYSEVPLISLFSVNFSGENRLEVDLFEQFPEEFMPQPALGHELIDLFTGQHNVFLVINSPIFNLLIISVDASGEVSVTANLPSKEGRLAAISENDTKIGISLAGGEVAAVDLATHDVTTLSPTGTPPVVCRVQWLNDETILIDEVVRCNTQNTQYFTPINTIAWTPSTGAIQNVTQAIAGDFTLIVPLSTTPESFTGLNQPPLAKAGVDMMITAIDASGFADVPLDGSQSTDNDGRIG